MFWIDYTVHSGPNCFTVEGDWPGEVMGWSKDGDKTGGLKANPLYQVGDIYVVDNGGWLRKQQLQPGDVAIVNQNGQLVKVASDTLEEIDNGKEKTKSNTG